MNLLVDTNILLWLLSEPERLAPSAIETMAAPKNQLWASSLSIFECTIKSQIGKLNVPSDLIAETQSQHMTFLSFSAEHAAAVKTLPLYHRDPFDRGLLAQARYEGFRLMTTDRELAKYGPEVDVMVV